MIINFDEPLTLGELVDKLETFEGIMAKFPSGENRYLNRYSRLSKSDAALPIVTPYKYDCASSRYLVKISTLEMYLRPSKTETHKIEPPTLGDIFKGLGRDEKIIVEFPNGITKTFYFGLYSSYYDYLYLVKSCEYDCPSGTYHVKLEKKPVDKLIKLALNYNYGIASMYPMMYNDEIPLNGLRIKKVIHSGPATIIFWNDGTKTIVKAQEDFDYEKGILYAALKKLATKKEYNDILRAIDKEDKACKDAFGIPEFSEEKSETKKHPSDQKCPYCGANWNMTIQRAKLLQMHGIIKITCGKCLKVFNVCFEDGKDEYVCVPPYKRGCDV